MNHLHSDKICLMKTSAKHVDSSCVQGESVILKGEYHWKIIPSVGVHTGLFIYYLKGLKGDMQCINFNALLHDHGSSTMKVSTEDSLFMLW